MVHLMLCKLYSSRTMKHKAVSLMLPTKLLPHRTLLCYAAFLLHTVLATHFTRVGASTLHFTPNSPSDSLERRWEREGRGEGECPDLPEVALERGGGGLGVAKLWRLSLELTDTLEVLDSLPPGDCVGRSAPASRPKRLNVRLCTRKKKLCHCCQRPWGDLTDGWNRSSVL